MRDKPTFENRRNTRTTTSLAEYMHLGSSGPVAMVRRGCKAEAQLEKANWDTAAVPGGREASDSDSSATHSLEIPRPSG
jgi:hypothetical protein